MTELWSALVIGLLSSFHCVGMCGPIALAIPTGNKPLEIFKNSLLYNFGRVITYSFLGLLVGFFGRLFFYSGLSQAISILMGVLIILGFTLSKSMINNVSKKIGIEYFTSILKSLFSKLFHSKSSFNVLLFGLINGFLPCGFVYLAAGNALVVANGVAQSMFYMMLFGFGTIPLMLLLLLSKSIVSVQFRNFLSKIVPIIAVILGILLIIRGLELDIPYLSPLINFSTSGEADVQCQ